MPVYVKLINCIFDTGYIPETWLIGAIKPIFKKKGSPLDPSNYRPITILSCLSKLFTSILNERITQFLNNNSILTENQSGFRAGYSTSDHVFTLKFLIDKIRSERKTLFVSFIDFSSCFDTIWRDGLWYKMLKSGISGKLFNIVKNMYQDIKSCVSVTDTISPFFFSHCGVRQGENLSPILFSIFLNDLDEQQQCSGITLNLNTNDTVLYLKLFTLLHADDTIIMSENAATFQNTLDEFALYCNHWKLKINLKKTKVMVFGKRKTSDLEFNINNSPLEIVQEYKYLGVLFSSSGNFKRAREELRAQASKAMYTLYLRINNLDLPIDLQLKLFDQTIVPILLYNCEVWGFENLDIIERVQTDFLRKITNSKKSTPLYMLYGEFGRYPLEIIVKTRMIKYWVKLITGKQSKISKFSYDFMLKSDVNFKWTNHIRNIINQTGYTFVWNDQYNTNLKNFHVLIKTRLLDQFIQNWQASMNNSSKGRNYNAIKQSFNCEQYLTLLPKKQRMALFRYRTCNHRLPIERHRWNGQYIHDHRRCQFCNSDNPPDEYHYLLICPYFSYLRHFYLPQYYFRYPQAYMFNELLCTNSTSLTTNVANLAHQIMIDFDGIP